MNPFTGGEHYLEEFLGIDASGYPLQREFSKEEKEIANINLVLKQKIIQNVSNLTIVAPSRWLYEEAQKSTVFNKLKVHCIPYGINSEIFQPRDKIYSRDILNIPKDKMVLLYVADSINNHRKGYAYLKKALDMIKRDDIVLCAVGSKNSDLELMNNIKELGAISDERLMSIVYSAADVFIIPSLMDNLPNTVLEALMCGTPVIGFPIGGIPDMLQNGFNGLVTSEVNSLSLCETIEIFLKTKDSFNRDEIRNNALSKYSYHIQAKNYLKLYKSILNT
jgi:glycosyltransferase involved in cell wall biosynthesis